MAVLEALACGIPCLLTPGTFMADEVAAAGAGVAAEIDSQSIANVFHEIVSGEHDLDAMGDAARIWASRNSWVDMATATLEAYSELLR